MYQKIRPLLKRITIFDFLITAVVVVATLFFAYTLFRKPSTINVTIKLGEDSVKSTPYILSFGSRPWLSSHYLENMTELDGLNRPLATVKSVQVYDVNPTNQAVYLNVDLKTTYTKASNQHLFRGTPVAIGSPIKLYPNNLFLEGVITHVEGLPDFRQRVTLKISAQLGETENFVYNPSRSIYRYIADTLDQGDKYVDNHGQTTMIITEKKTIPAKNLFVSSQGQVWEKDSADKVIVFLNLEVNAIKINNRYFLFDDLPLQIGSGIPLVSTKTTIYPVVTAIEEIDQAQ